MKLYSLISVSVEFYGTHMNYTYKVMNKLHIVVFQGIRNYATDTQNEVFSLS